MKRVLRLREIYNINFLECDLSNGRLLLTVDCESGTYIRTLCYHIGLLVGCEAYMAELRRTRSGFLTAKTNMVTLHQVLDACWLYKERGDDSYLRKVVMPLEFLLIKMKKVIIKDSAVNAICHGAPVLIQGVIRYSGDIDNGDKVVVVTTKGEAVALGTAMMNSADIAGLNHGVTVQPTRIIMDRDLYAKCWGKGPVAVQRKQLIKDGLLDKHGEIIEGKTPESYINRHLDVQKFLETAGATCANSIKVERPQDIKQEEWNTVDVCGGAVEQEKPRDKSADAKKEEKKESKKEEKKEKKSDDSKSHKEKKEHHKEHKDKSEKHKDKSRKDKDEKHENK